MGRGYRGEGIFHSAPMAPDTTINKGDVVAFNGDRELVVAPANHDNPMGVAAETKTSRPDETPELAYVLHGIAQAKAFLPVKAGQSVMAGSLPGTIERLHGPGSIGKPRKILGVALEDIGEDEYGDVFLGGA